jgi:putative membrane protein
MVSQQNEQIVLAQERTRLASERTFLSWVRTGLATVGGGVAVLKLLFFVNQTHQVLAKIAGSLLVILGIGMFFLSLLDYGRSYQKLKVKNGFAASMKVITVIILALIIISLLLLYIAAT